MFILYNIHFNEKVFKAVDALKRRVYVTIAFKSPSLSTLPQSLGSFFASAYCGTCTTLVL